MTRLLAIVPARAGSKGVPGKNKAPIKGRPLIDYTVAALEASSSVDGILHHHRRRGHSPTLMRIARTSSSCAGRRNLRPTRRPRARP